ncbi:MAG: Hsp70 family protein [Myxococcota bacterium]
MTSWPRCLPAYFNDRQRQAVHEAGREVGLDVVRVINEPTAAAMAYGAGRGLEETVAVFDLGGGTFDVSVIEISDDTFEVKATGGDLFLGGLDFDESLVQFILGEFATQSDVDLTTDPVAMQRIRDTAEQAKIDLSSRAEVPFNVPFVTMTESGQPVNIDLVLKREDIDLLCEPLIDRTFETCLKVCEDAGVQPNELDQIILVGGQTRMPLIAARVATIFGREASKMIHPDEAVAVGAALYASSLQEGSTLELQLLDVLPMAIGIEGANGTLHRLFEKNASVPNQQVFNFTTHKDNQVDMVMRLYQGNDDTASNNTLLGEFTFSGIRPGAAGSVRLEVTFDVSVEGILSLAARDLDTGAEMHQTVRFGR